MGTRIVNDTPLVLEVKENAAFSIILKPGESAAFDNDELRLVLAPWKEWA